MERPARVLFKHSQITVRRAALAIAACTVIVTVAGGIGMWALDHKEYSSIGGALWWSVQTITTVGYGDNVPTRTEGRLIATITAAFVESARTRMGRGRYEEILKRLEQIEKRLDERDRTRQS